MAEKKSDADDAAPPKGKGKLLLLIIIGVLVLVLGGGGAFMMMKKKTSAEDEELDDGAAKTEKVRKAKKDHPDAPPVFVKFEPFTVKLQPEQTEAYLQATPELQVLDAAVAERVKQYSPAIRHKVLLLLSGKKPSELSNPQGMQRLSNEVRDAINLILDGPKVRKGKGEEAAPAEPSDTASPDDSVQAVMFTSFIIQ